MKKLFVLATALALTLSCISGAVAVPMERSTSEDVTEEYMKPIKVSEGGYEYRNSKGELLSICYENAEDVPEAVMNAQSSRRIESYLISMIVGGMSWEHGDERINTPDFVTLEFDINFAHEGKSYLGYYDPINEHVSWLSPGEVDGFYYSMTYTGSFPMCVAIKNVEQEANKYTGTLDVIR